MTGTYPDCTRVGVWYWINSDGTYEIESTHCLAYAPPSGGGGSGGGGGDSCYDGTGGNSSDPLCEPFNPTEVDGEENPWSVAAKIDRKILKAAERGEDLLDAKTWKNMLESEWAEAVDAGLNTQAALNGDVVALFEVLNYIAGQVVGVDFLGMLDGLKIADCLGLGGVQAAIMRSNSAFLRF